MGQISQLVNIPMTYMNILTFMTPLSIQFIQFHSQIFCHTPVGAVKSNADS